MDRRRKSAFVEPPKDERSKRCRDLLVVPPTVHVASFVTGGLRDLYNNIRCKTTRQTHQSGIYTDQQGCFDPQPNMPLLAKRYRFVDVIGKGQSSVIVKAKDSFQNDNFVSIKVLHTTNFLIGSQEADIMLEMNNMDPWNYVPIVKLLNVFSFDDHYCLTFDLLHPDPINDHFKALGLLSEEFLVPIRDVTIKLLSVLGFLSRINIIHADLKPDNILLQDENSSSSIKVVDFGNAIRCVHEELSLYYTDYELQTLIYRAPEVLLGLSFGLQIDAWSLGCIIAELYLGQPLFLGRNKTEVLTKITSILGPLPEEFSRGEYSSQFSQFVGVPWSKFEIMQKLNNALGQCCDWKFVDFLSGLLSLSPDERTTPSLAIRHPFLASSLPYLYLCAPTTQETQFYSSILPGVTYPRPPSIRDHYVNILKSRRRNSKDLEESQSEKTCQEENVSLVDVESKPFAEKPLVSSGSNRMNLNATISKYSSKFKKKWKSKDVIKMHSVKFVNLREVKLPRNKIQVADNVTQKSSPICNREVNVD